MAEVAGAILSSLFSVLFERLASREVLEFFKDKKLDQRLLDKLKTRMNTITALLDDAEEKQITSTAVKKWLDDLKDATYQADDFLDEIAYEAPEQQLLQLAPKTCLYRVRSFLSSLNLCKKGVREMEPGLKVILDRLEDLLQQTNTLGLVAQVGVRPPPSQGRVTTSLVDDSSVYGKDADKKAIIHSLLSDDPTGKSLGVVPIVGMGGVGKTTLAQLVYQDSQVKQRFGKLRVWICVSDEFDVLKLTKAILKGFGSSDSDSTSLDLLHHELEKKVRGERVLVVLDDVWNEKYVDWELLLAPLNSAEEGSKVLVTTRNESVASVMSTVPSHHLKELSEDDCWLLFARVALDGGRSSVYGELEGIGRKIVKKCKGLPLATKTLGGLLHSKKDARAWEMVLKSNMWDMPRDSIVPALRLSYHYLPPHLKQCFAYCAVFPKDFRFSKKDLVLLWMAEGFIVQTGNIKEMEEMGIEYFDELVSRSFFQRSSEKYFSELELTTFFLQYFEYGIGVVDSWFVMHDLINDLARSIAGEFCLNMEDVDSAGQCSRRTRHLFCAEHRYEDSEGLRRAEFLRTFICSENKVSDPLSIVSGRLRVLDMTFSPPINAADIWFHIGRLKYLRFMRVQGITIKELPENMVSTFYYLQTLILDYCWGLKRLPDSIGNLKNLRHLNLHRISIRLLPDSIGNLKDLRYLSLWSNDSLELLLDSIGNLKELRYLNLGDTRSLKLLPDSIGNLKDLKYLNLEYSTIQRLPDSASGLVNLQYLSLHGCRQLVELPAKMMDFVNLLYLDIRDTQILKSMPPHMGKLVKLQRLSDFIVGIDGGDSIAELRHLGNLQGMLVLRNLQNVGDVEDAMEAHLKDKSRLEGLKYVWKDNDNNNNADRHDGSVDRELLQQLQPHVNATSITIEGYRDANFPNWVGDSSFSNIVKLSLINCKYCTCLPPLGQLASLEDLRIQGFDSIVSVGAEFYGDSKSMPQFRSLKKLGFHSMPKWQEWTFYKNDGEDDSCTVFPLLKDLTINDCPVIEMALREGILFKLSSLSLLNFRYARGIESFPGMILLPCSLVSISIGDLQNLKSLDYKGLEQLTSLERLSIDNCPNLGCIPDEGLPESLDYLCINNCPLLEKRWEQGEDWAKLSRIPMISINSGPNWST